MLSINKIYCWLFVFALLIQIPSIHLIKFLDELLVFFMMVLVFLDVVVNKQYKKYKLLWIITGVMSFYAVYSLVWVSYNTPKAVMYDFIAQMKPFCYFCVSLAVVPKFDNKTKMLLKLVCVVNSVIVLFCFVTGLTKIVFMHVAYLGLVSVISFLIYIICSCDENGKITKKDLCLAVIMLTIGLVSTRSKFYGEYVFTLYLLFFYKVGMMKYLQIKHVLLFVFALILVICVAWEKIDYYFISGGQVDMAFDEDLLSSFARPVLYASMILILQIHPLFGTGLASFATNASSTNVQYSQAYRMLGIDEVWGLSEDFDSYICDAFYPELAQFGIVGIVLFIYFFVWVYRKVSLLLYSSGKVLYVVGIVSIVVILIESVASTTFNQGVGAMCMMILGCLVSNFKNITKKQEIEIREMPYKECGTLDYIK